MSETIKVGDVVAWAKVPDGALVRRGPHDVSHGLRPIITYWFVKLSTVAVTTNPAQTTATTGRWLDAVAWDCLPDPKAECRIVALGLTGEKTAAEVQRLAEVFEVREALFVAESRGWLCVVIGAGTASPRIIAEGDNVAAVADRLHAAGWRPGMTAEDAARLLSEK